MDELLQKLLEFPPQSEKFNSATNSQYDAAIKQHVTALGKTPEKNFLQQSSSDQSALDLLDPAVNTVSYIFVLLAHIAAVHKAGKSSGWVRIWDKFANLLENFDTRQIRFVGKEFNYIIETTAKHAHSSQKISLVIKPIRNAILRLDPSGSLLTSTHVLLVKLALESREYGAVLPVIDKPIFQFPGASNQPKPESLSDLSLPPSAFITIDTKLTTRIKYHDVLEYFLYSGMVYMGLRRWENALECLENAVTYPSKDVSKIMVEAYKKWVLVGLLLEGKFLQLPKYTSINATKAYHTIAKPYEAVAQIFETGTASRLKAEVEIGHQIWQDDCNTGLIFNILSEYQKFQIRNLANIYSKISIPEVNQLTTSAETGSKLQSPSLAETLVRGMIADGSLDATLSNSPTGHAILTFKPIGSKLSEKQVEEELQASKNRILLLADEIKRTDRILTWDKEYLKHVQKLQRLNREGLADQGIAGGDLDWNSVEDEDIMTGVTY